MLNFCKQNKINTLFFINMHKYHTKMMENHSKHWYYHLCPGIAHSQDPKGLSIFFPVIITSIHAKDHYSPGFMNIMFCFLNQQHIYISGQQDLILFIYRTLHKCFIGGIFPFFNIKFLRFYILFCATPEYSLSLHTKKVTW